MLQYQLIDGQNVSIITTPKVWLLITPHIAGFIICVNYQVVQAAREHYNCSTLLGVPLENNGAEGSRGLSDWFLACQCFIAYV